MALDGEVVDDGSGSGYPQTIGTAFGPAGPAAPGLPGVPMECPAVRATPGSALVKKPVGSRILKVGRK
ncbi:hypothetical protein AB0O64_25790 [Streptomyces sp. NPDC088341]|uniref:hypothetical protein n=1 Tax=Streptomyces sp. NPDC088341 TaxID=3154870 RepID=UPI0034141D21